MNEIATNVMWTSLIVFFGSLIFSLFIDKPDSGFKSVKQIRDLLVGSSIMLSPFVFFVSLIIKIWS